jgi:hypothetical protein
METTRVSVNLVSAGAPGVSQLQRFTNRWRLKKWKWKQALLLSLQSLSFISNPPDKTHMEATGDLSNFLEDLALLIEENFENNRVPLLYLKAIKSYVQK